MKPKKHKVQYYIDGEEVSNVKIWGIAIKEGLYLQLQRKKYTIADAVYFLITKGYNIESKTIIDE